MTGRRLRTLWINRKVPSAPRQIERLAAVIMDEIPGEPSRNEGAVDTAIRLLRAAYPQPSADGESDLDAYIRIVRHGSDLIPVAEAKAKVVRTILDAFEEAGIPPDRTRSEP